MSEATRVSVEPGTWTMPAIGTRPRTASATATTSLNSPDDEIPTIASPGAERGGVGQELRGRERDHDRVVRPGVTPVQRGRREARVVARAVADDVDAADARRAPRPRRSQRASARAEATVARIAAGPSRISRGTMPSIIARASVPGSRDRGRRASDRRNRRVGLRDDQADALVPEGVRGVGCQRRRRSPARRPPRDRTRSPGRPARTWRRRRARRPSAPSAQSARSMRISGTESFIRPCSTLIAPMPMNSRSARSSLCGELGEVAEHRVHARAHDAAQDDQLDALAVEQHVRDVEGVGDDGESAVGDLPRELAAPCCRCRSRSSPRRGRATRRPGRWRASPPGAGPRWRAVESPSDRAAPP